MSAFGALPARSSICTYSVVVLGVDAQQVDDVDVGAARLAPLGHLGGTEVVRGVDVSGAPAAGHLLEEVVADLLVPQGLEHRALAGDGAVGAHAAALVDELADAVGGVHLGLVVEVEEVRDGIGGSCGGCGSGGLGVRGARGIEEAEGVRGVGGVYGSLLLA